MTVVQFDPSRRRKKPEDEPKGPPPKKKNAFIEKWGVLILIFVAFLAYSMRGEIFAMFSAKSEIILSDEEPERPVEVNRN